MDGIVQRSIAAGARLVEGGTHDGLFYRPTVLADVTIDLPAWTDEIFGPVAPVTTFATDDEAVALANESEYGLVASIFTRSISRGMAIAAQFRWRQPFEKEDPVPQGRQGVSGARRATTTTRPS